MKIDAWDLEGIYPGGSQSKELQGQIQAFKQHVKDLGVLVQKKSPLSDLLLNFQELEKDEAEIEAFVHCLCAQNTQDRKAEQLVGELSNLKAELSTLGISIDNLLKDLSPKDFEALLSDPKISTLSYAIEEKRRLAKEKLSVDKETLITALSVDGYHGWNEIYNTLIGKIQIQDGEEKLSVGQAENRLHKPDERERSIFFKKWCATWKSNEETFAQVLNHMGGFRLKIYEMRGWESVLKEPLFANRMQKKTLDIMWQVVEKNKKPFIAYLERKAELMGKPKLAWHDVDVPFFTSPKTQISFEEAAALIVEEFEQFNPKMANFAKKAFKERWIEAENRAFKRPGGFCIHFPKSCQSRIFMTFSGTLSNLSTLAHELGHAYHSYLVEDLPYFLQQYRMNVAETASTFAELIVADAAVKKSGSNTEKLFFLDDKIQSAVAFLINIHARFIFEKSFYEKRKHKALDPEEISQLMIKAQIEAYSDSLETWNPHFWASKMHFYFIDVPFYNFPYTFGYLLSFGLYARASKEGKKFAQKLDPILRDSGQMEVEDLLQKHLNVDLTKAVFWQEAIDAIKVDIEEFLILSESLLNQKR